MASPEWFLTLTDVGESWQSIRKTRAVLHQRFRRRGCDPQYAWVVECAATGRQHHLHLLAWGVVPSLTALRQEAIAVGWGREVDVRRVVDGRAPGYLFKQVVNSGGQLEHFLSMNGGRLVHATRGFWRDGGGGTQVRGGLEGLLKLRTTSRGPE